MSPIQGQALHIEIVVLLYGACPIGQAIHAFVVENSDLPALDLEHIHFNHINTQLEGLLNGSKGVFGFISHSSAVSNDQDFTFRRGTTTHKDTQN